MFSRGRLRHVDNESPQPTRRADEQRLYNTSSPSPSPTPRHGAAQGQPSWEQPSSRSNVIVRQDSDSHQNGAPSRESMYGRIQPRSHQRPPSPQTPPSSSLSRRVPSPTSPRPRTPTEDERLTRLLNTEEGEFIVVDEEGQNERDKRQHKSRLKEIAREGQTHEVLVGHQRVRFDLTGTPLFASFCSIGGASTLFSWLFKGFSCAQSRV